MIKTTFWDTLFFLFFVSLNVSAQVNPWKEIAPEAKQKTLVNTVVHTSYKLDVALVNTLFNTSPNMGDNKSVLLQFPVENRGFRTFKLSKSNVLHPRLASKFPQIKTYTGYSVDRTSSSIRVSYTPSLGLRAVIMEQNKETYHITKIKGSNSQYSSYKNADVIVSDFGFECDMVAGLQNKFGLSGSRLSVHQNNRVLRKYRLALAVSGEYAAYFLDGSERNDTERKEKVLAAIVATISRVNSIFERDFGITMELVENNDQILFLDSATDPFQSLSDFGTGLNEQLQVVLDDADYIGREGYDIGHLFHKTIGSRSGNAGCIACVCINGRKGSAYSQHPNPETDDFCLLAAHEFGHQFGAYHVQSSSNCRSGFNSEVEPGSGSTIMGYAGICSPNVQQYPDDYFNYVDIRDVRQWITNGGDCGVIIPLTENRPVVDAGPDYTIPIATPFILEGVDPEIGDSANWTYCWEQMDSESPVSAQTPQPTWLVGPLFRSRLPSASRKRYMPQLVDVLSGNEPTWEMLPSVTRELNFVLTVRDNVLNGGQTASDAMVVNVTNTAGPFRVTSQSSQQEVWNVGEEVTVTWDVANTNSAPVNAEKVDVYVSIDGGYTYPNLVQSKITNNGSITFPLPLIPSTTAARVMVRGHGTIFYAVNTANFTIQTSEFLITPEANTKDFCKSDLITFDFNYRTILDFDDSTTFGAINLPKGVEVQVSPTSMAGKHIIDTPIVVTLTGTESLEVGSYDFIFKGTTEDLERQVVLRFCVFDNEIKPPVLKNPSNNEDSVIPDIVFEWEADTNVKTYTIEIASDESFEHLVDSADLEDNVYVSKRLVADTQYFWRVIGVNSCDVIQASPIYMFTTFCKSPSGLRTTDIKQSSIALTWDSDAGTGLWEIEYGMAGFDLGTGNVQTIMVDQYVIEGLVSHTEYDIYLRTLCTAGGGSFVKHLAVKTAENYCETNRFFDSGGKNETYGHNENRTTVINTATDDERIRVSFESFELEHCCDRLTIYDGPDQNAPILFSGGKMTLPSIFVSSHVTGALTFVFTSDSSVAGSGWDAMVTCENKPSCNAPVEFKNTNISTTSLDFSWVADGSSSWELEYGLKGFIPGSGKSIIVNSTNYMIPDLETSTNYDVYLRAICTEGGYSSLVGPISVSTLCNTYVAPFYEDFVTSTIPDCWSESGNSRWYFVTELYLENNQIVTNHTPNMDSKMAYIRTNNFGTGLESMLTSRPVDISGLVTPSIQFAVYSTIASSDQYNGLEVAFYDGAVWNTITTITEATSGWREYFFDISSYTISNNIQVRFTIQDHVTKERQYIFIDDLVIDEMPTCIPPNKVWTGHATQSAAIINWSVDSAVGQYELVFGKQGFELEDGEYVFSSGTEVLLENLTSDTPYEVYVRAHCQIDDYSEWIGPILFSTARNYCSGGHFYDTGGANNFYQNNEYETTVIVPEKDTDIISVRFVSFQLESCCDYLMIYDGLDTEAPIIGRYSGDISPETIKATNTSGALTFLFTSDGSVTHRGWDAVVECLPKCKKPEIEDVVLDKITKTTAVLTRETFLDTNIWEVQYGHKGFVLGTGNLESSEVSIIELSNLASNLNYDLYIRDICDNQEVSEWVGPISFTTDGDFCNGDHFYDSGMGTDNYGNGEHTTTVITPNTDRNRVSVSFNYFSLGSGDLLEVFDGPDITAPFLGSYSATILPEVLVSTHVSGALAFRFTSDENDTGSGWEAVINCSPQPNCASPTRADVHITDITSNAVVLTLDHINDAGWQLEYGTVGFELGKGTSVNGSQETVYLANLISGQSYDVYIKYGCEEGGYSDPTNPIRFTTSCELIEAPNEYVQNGSFECGTGGSWDILGTNSFSGCSYNFLIKNKEELRNVCASHDIMTPTNGMYAAYTSFDGDARNRYILQQSVRLPQSGFVVEQAVLSYDFVVDYSLMKGERTNQRILETALYDNAGNLIAIVDDQSFNVGSVQRFMDAKVSVDISGYIKSYLGEDIFIRFTEQIAENFTGTVSAMIDDISLDIREATLSIDQQDDAFVSLKLFPNPTGSLLTVQSGMRIHKITLIDMLGKVVFTESGSNGQEISLNLGFLHSGAYFIQVWTPVGVITKRVLKK